MVKEVRILETAEDIQDRREQVLSRYSQFLLDARLKRDKLEDSRKFQVRILSLLMSLCVFVAQVIIFTYLRRLASPRSSLLRGRLWQKDIDISLLSPVFSLLLYWLSNYQHFTSDALPHQGAPTGDVVMTAKPP